MSRRTIVAISIGLALLLVAGAAVFAGPVNAEGAVLGLAGGLVGAWGLALTARVTGNLARAEPANGMGGTFVELALLLLKLPLIGVCGWLAQGLGHRPLGFFAAGFCLVYFALVWGAASQA